MTEPICQPNLEETLITEQIRMPTTNDFCISWALHLVQLFRCTELNTGKDYTV